MFYKAVSPGAIGHENTAFIEAAPIVASCGFQGYWFDPNLDFSCNPDEVRALLEEYDLRAAGCNLPVEFRKTEETWRADMDHLQNAVTFARQIGITRMMTWIVPFSNELSFDENMALHVRRLRPACEILQDNGITLGLEFQGPPKLRKGVKHTFVYNLEGILQLCREIGTGNCGVLLDAWHWDLAEQVFSDFSKLPDPSLIVAAHIADAPANIPAVEQEDLIRRLPGTTGIIHIDAFFAGLKKAGFNGPVIAEPFESFLSEIPFEESLRITMRSINRVWPD